MANIIANALSRKARSMCSLDFLCVSKLTLAEDIQSFANSIIKFDISNSRRGISSVGLQSSLDWICRFQFEDESFVAIRYMVLEGYARQGTLDLVGF